MHYADQVLRDAQVLHRRQATSLSSPATMMRRLRAGAWWKPTSATVAMRTEFPDPHFDLLVAAAHVWPRGGISGPSLQRLFAITADAGPITVSTPRNSRPPNHHTLVVTRRTDVCLGFAKVGRRDVAVDVGPASLAEALAGLDLAASAWVLIKSRDCVADRSQQLQLMSSFDAQVRRRRDLPAKALSEFASAVMDGCESAGEVYVWVILQNLGLKFECQRSINLLPGSASALGQQRIRTDFILEGGIIIEVDSMLHEHLRDVRRDMWNLVEGRRTLRIVGTDVIAHPEFAQTQLVAALRQLGVAVRSATLPSWLQAA